MSKTTAQFQFNKNNLILTAIFGFAGMLAAVVASIAVITPIVHAEMTGFAAQQQPSYRTAASVAPAADTSSCASSTPVTTESENVGNQVVTTATAPMSKPWMSNMGGVNKVYKDNTTTNVTNTTNNTTTNINSNNTVGSNNTSNHTNVKVTTINNKNSNNTNVNSGNTHISNSGNVNSGNTIGNTVNVASNNTDDHSTSTTNNTTNTTTNVDSGNNSGNVASGNTFDSGNTSIDSHDHTTNNTTTNVGSNNNDGNVVNSGNNHQVGLVNVN